MYPNITEQGADEAGKRDTRPRLSAMTKRPSARPELYSLAVGLAATAGIRQAGSQPVGQSTSAAASVARARMAVPSYDKGNMLVLSGCPCRLQGFMATYWYSQTKVPRVRAATYSCSPLTWWESVFQQKQCAPALSQHLIQWGISCPCQIRGDF